MAYSEIDARLNAKGVDTGEFGFYDQAAFLALERVNPAILDDYATWVIERPRTKEYDKHVRRVVPKVAGIIERHLEREGALGACLNVAMMAVSMLNRLGVWSVAVRGALTVDMPLRPDLGSRYFPHMDLLDDPSNIVGHGWLVAPPFKIVDMTVKHQHWVALPDSLRRALPDVLLSEATVYARPTWKDLVSNSVIEANQIPIRERTDRLPYLMNPGLAAFERRFPGFEVNTEGLRLKYFPSANTVSDGPLEAMQWVSPTTPGLKPIDIWNEDVGPEFGL